MPELNYDESRLYYAIGDVAAMLGVNESLLRFWEKEFPHIAPKKNARGVRQYTKEDIEKIKTVYDLVKGRGLKIAAAREILKRNKDGVSCPLEAVSRLRAVRAELVAMKDALAAL